MDIGMLVNPRSAPSTMYMTDPEITTTLNTVVMNTVILWRLARSACDSTDASCTYCASLRIRNTRSTRSRYSTVNSTVKHHSATASSAPYLALMAATLSSMTTTTLSTIAITSVPSKVRSASESCWNMMSCIRTRSDRGMTAIYERSVTLVMGPGDGSRPSPHHA